MTNRSFGERPPAGGRGKFSRALAVSLVALATTVSLLASNGKAQAEAPASNAVLTAAQRDHIHLYTVAPAKFRKTIEATGVVDFDNDQATSVLAPFSGPVSRLLVSLGDRVTKGQPLAAVDSPDFATAISTYRKALATAKTARRLADLDKDLLQHQGVARREAEQAQTDAVNAEADSEAALQGLVALNVDPQAIKDIQEGRPIQRIEGLVRSPIAGTVAEKLISPGLLLQAGTTPCFTIADLSRMWVVAQVFGSDLASIGIGDSAEVTSDIGSRKFSGTVTNIAALVNPDTRSIAVRVVVENPGDLLKKQMYVRLLIQSRQESSGLLVPVSAILRDDENLPFVYLAQPDGSFARQHVTLGYRTGDQYDIPEGLRDGNQIVVEGGIFIQFMQNQ